jgi:ABC-2 type transport system permease protein
MTEILKLTELKLRIFLNSLKRPTHPWKKIFFSLLGIIFLAGMYFWLRRILVYLVNVPLIGEVVLLRFVSLMIFIGAVLAVLSSMLSAVSTIYATEELRLLIPYPVSQTGLFVVKAVEAAIYADWMIVVIAIPFAFAWNYIYSLSFLQFLFCAVSFFLFLFAMSSLGIILATLFAVFFPSKKIRDGAIILFAVFFGGMFFYLKALEPRFIFHADMFENFFQYLARLQMPGFPLAPFQWLSRLFIEISSGNYSAAFVIFGVLFLFCVFVGTVSFFIGGKTLFRTCGKIRGAGGHSIYFGRKIPVGKIAALKWREKIVFLRNSEQVSQMAILGMLVAIYLFSVWKAPLGDIPYVRELLSFLNIGAVGLILTAAVLRFVYTGFCLDGKFLWLLFSSPFSSRDILKSKLSVYAKPVVFFGFLLGIVSGVCFKAGFAFVLFTGIASAIIGFVVVHLAFYFAVSYPNYRTDNLSQIESSYGGIIFMITAIFYIVTVLSILAMPVYWGLMGKIYRSYAPVRFSVALILLFLLDSFVFSMIPRKMTFRIFSGKDHRDMVVGRQ